MYVNFKILKSAGLNTQHLLMLQMCKQSKFEDLSEEIKNIETEFKGTLDSLIESDYISFIKGDKKDSTYQKVRTTKKGNQLLENIETPEISEDDLIMFDWLCGVYTSEDKMIGNKKKTKSHIANFRVQSGIERNELANLLTMFINDEENMMYNQKLENMLWKSTNVYATKFELDESRLWQYYLKHKEVIDLQFKSIA